jgi:hypothetical protein
MNRTVLGLIGVFVVQAGFIGYTALERQSNEFLTANGVPIVFEPIVSDSAIVTDIDPSLTEIEPLPGESPRTAFIVNSSARRSRRRSTATQFLVARRTQPLVKTTTAMFVPRIITVPTVAVRPRTEHPGIISNESGTNRFVAFTKPVARVEKRSFAAKSVSVLKKPFDWLKAIASRLR